MEKPLNQFIQRAKDVRLSGDASLRIRERLVAHMHAHPPVAPVPSPYQPFVNTLLASLRRPPVAFAALLFVALGGMTASATSGALPGDALYPLKVSVMEPVRGLFAASPEAKAEWKVALTNTRLSEVETLATREALTPEQSIHSQRRFDDSFTETELSLAELSGEDPDAAARIEESLNTSLEVHEKILAVIGSSPGTKGAAEAETLARHVGSKIRRAKGDAMMLSATATSSFEAATTTATTTPR